MLCSNGRGGGAIPRAGGTGGTNKNATGFDVRGSVAFSARLAAVANPEGALATSGARPLAEVFSEPGAHELQLIELVLHERSLHNNSGSSRTLIPSRACGVARDPPGGAGPFRAAPRAGGQSPPSGQRSGTSVRLLSALGQRSRPLRAALIQRPTGPAVPRRALTTLDRGREEIEPCRAGFYSRGRTSAYAGIVRRGSARR